MFLYNDLYSTQIQLRKHVLDRADSTDLARHHEGDDADQESICHERCSSLQVGIGDPSDGCNVSLVSSTALQLPTAALQGMCVGPSARASKMLAVQFTSATTEFGGKGVGAIPRVLFTMKVKEGLARTDSACFVPRSPGGHG